MEDLLYHLQMAKKELHNKINKVPGMELEYAEIQELERQLAVYIIQGEQLLKQYNKKKK